MKRLTVGLLMASCVPLAGCGVVNAVNQFQDNQEYRSTASDYKSCLLANREPRACENLRLAMEADQQKARGAANANVNLNVRQQ